MQRQQLAGLGSVPARQADLGHQADRCCRVALSPFRVATDRARSAGDSTPSSMSRCGRADAAPPRRARRPCGARPRGRSTRAAPLASGRGPRRRSQRSAAMRTRCRRGRGAAPRRGRRGGRARGCGRMSSRGRPATKTTNRNPKRYSYASFRAASAFADPGCRRVPPGRSPAPRSDRADTVAGSAPIRGCASSSSTCSSSGICARRGSRGAEQLLLGSEGSCRGQPGQEAWGALEERSEAPWRRLRRRAR